MQLPVTLYASIIAYAVSILSLIKYRSIGTRIALWIIIAVSNTIAIANAKNFTPDRFYNWWWILLSIHQTLFMSFLYRLDRTNLAIPGHLTHFQRLLHAWATFWNYRGIGTRWQVSYIPPERVLGFRVERPTTRPRFLKIRIFNFLIMYFAICLWYDPLCTPRGFTVDDFAVEKDPFFRRLNEVTLREFLVRLYITLEGEIPPWLALNATHAAISILAILAGGKPEEWPPFFGSIMEAYSMRRYWRYFWHQIIRRSFPSTGSIFTELVCGLERGTRLHGIVNAFVVFFLSGLMHYAAESHWDGWKVGRTILWWWSLQELAILAEEYVQAFYLKNKPKLEQALGFRIGHGWERLVGYMWVSSFLFWSDPRLGYAKYRATWGKPS